MILWDSPRIEAHLDALASAIAARYAAASRPPLLIGIHTGGVWLAQALHRRLQAPLDLDEPAGTVDVSFYRDDLARSGVPPQAHPSQVSTSVDGREIVLVDDVLYTGRTVRAAMNELFDYGRPSAIRLAVLILRNGRQLPIAPDFPAEMLSLEPGERIKLAGPDPLQLHLLRSSPSAHDATDAP
ncbi:MAG: bifunctional pyr operon transcriptional regulator/uracil phosphoribosyltransferase PyrR [Pseudomonadota bacterium]